MIHFTCKGCGKRHVRDEDAAGTLVFCECGMANRLPWPEERPEEAAELQALPVAELANAPQTRGRSEVDWQPDPDVCLNHPRSARTAACADCGESFCGDCLVGLQDQRLCGPCKNLRVRRLQQPPRLAASAIAAFVVSLLAAGVSFLMVFALAGMNAPLPARLLALLPPVAGLLLSAIALRRVEGDARVRGRAAAIAGLVGSGVALHMLMAIALLVPHDID
jgi:hypothetical protein